MVSASCSVCVCVCVCVCVAMGFHWGQGLFECSVLGLVVSDKLEHQSTVKNKLTSPSSIIILRDVCSTPTGLHPGYHQWGQLNSLGLHPGYHYLLCVQWGQLNGVCLHPGYHYLLCVQWGLASFPGSPSFHAIIPRMTFDPPQGKAEGEPGRFCHMTRVMLRHRVYVSVSVLCVL